MRTLVIIALLLILPGCWLSGPEVTKERLAQVNETWFKMYSADRRMTEAETAEYAALSDEQKLEWRKAGKPVDKPLLFEKADAALDFYKAVNLEAGKEE